MILFLKRVHFSGSGPEIVARNGNYKRNKITVSPLSFLSQVPVAVLGLSFISIYLLVTTSTILVWTPKYIYQHSF